MKSRLLFILLGGICFISLPSCKKESSQESLSQGNNFNLLLKTEKKSSSNDVVTVNYSYNSAGQLTEINSAFNNNPASPGTSKELFYRNSAGRLDSISLIQTEKGSIVYKPRTYFHYDNTNSLLYSIRVDAVSSQPTRDSSVYMYAGTVLQTRIDYRRFGNAAYSLLCQANYQFTNTGNLDKVFFTWTTHPGTDSISFRYDNKVNPLPINNNPAFYWAQVFYNDYKAGNNPVFFSITNGSTYYTVYAYGANNRPLYSKSVENGSSYFYETWYYYD